MPKIDDYELEVLSAFEKGKLKSVATKSELARFKAAARSSDEFPSGAHRRIHGFTE